MEKVIKSYSDLLKKEVTITIDARLNEAKASESALKKLEQANKSLRKLKSLPK